MIRNITKPTLVIDKMKCLENIKRMSDKAKKSSVRFRPHFKTHQSAEVGEWFRGFGVKSISVSSVSMANYFMRHGWRDITIAFPVNIREIEDINEMVETAPGQILQSHDSTLPINLLVISRETIKFLDENLKSLAGIYIKINTGYNRTGFLPEDTEMLNHCLRDIRKSKRLVFKGFLTHAGHTYNAKSKEEVVKIHEDTKQILLNLKNRYITEFKEIEISVGDTPSCSIAEDFCGADEIRPGNFIYHDLMQYEIGSCSLDDIAAVLACPVVGKDSTRNEIFIYGGAVHLSKEFLQFDNGVNYYGKIVMPDGKAWSTPLKDTYISGLSQEHGIIKTNSEHFDDFNTGDIIGVLPVHSCLTANLMKQDTLIVSGE